MPLSTPSWHRAPHEARDKPGFTAALCLDGEVIWSNPCGEASLEWGVPNGPNTVYRLAFTSQHFTTAAILILAQDGALHLDEPMTAYLSEFTGTSPTPTKRQMLHHTR
jgi:CubicO group peptidase (beta-lactamase class C family)